MKQLLNILFTLAFVIFTLGLHAQVDETVRQSRNNTTDARDTTNDIKDINQPKLQRIELSDVHAQVDETVRQSRNNTTDATDTTNDSPAIETARNVAIMDASNRGLTQAVRVVEPAVIARDTTNDSTTIERPELQPIELSDEIKNNLDQYRNEQDSLRVELRERLDALEEPTRDSRRGLIEAFRREHATRIAVQKERSIDIRNAQRQYQLDNVTDRPVRDDLSTAVTDRKALFEQRRAELLEKRRALRSDMESASNEDRLKIIEDFREENRQLLRDQKQLRRQLRDDLRDDLSGDRRPTE